MAAAERAKQQALLEAQEQRDSAAAAEQAAARARAEADRLGAQADLPQS